MDKKVQIRAMVIYCMTVIGNNMLEVESTSQRGRMALILVPFF